MFSKSKYMQHNRTSYGLKHACESTVGFYIHNDAIKKAFLLEGYKAETGKINWFFNAKGEVSKAKIEKFKELFKEDLMKKNKK